VGLSGEYFMEKVLVEESSTGSVGLFVVRDQCVEVFVVRDQCVEVFVERDEIGKDQDPVIPNWDYMNYHYGFQV